MIRLDKKDYLRSLLTDTAPSDVPIVFSNDGFYVNMKEETTETFDIVKSLSKHLIKERSQKETIPFRFPIYKNEVRTRTISLVHPASQYSYAVFYKDYADSIAYLCSKSKFSVRAPYRLCYSLYIKKELPRADVVSEHISPEINTIYADLYKKHAQTFFAYRGFTRTYKIYESNRFIALERKFQIFWKMDVANCFNSIYTHSIAWAIKNKDYAKKSRSGKNYQFADYLDLIVRMSNHAETNGLPIGSEFSRVVAEIVFQEIDRKVESSLREDRLYHGQHYEIMRYVDDYYLFAADPNIIERVNACLVRELEAFNLYLNAEKLEKYQRPFITQKSAIGAAVKSITLEFINKLIPGITKDSSSSGFSVVRDREALKRYFLNQIKSAAHMHSGDYSDITPLAVSIIANNLVSNMDRLEGQQLDSDDYLNVRNCICLSLDIVFHLYSLSPSVASSQRLAKFVVVSDKFMQREGARHRPFFRAEVISNVQLIIRQIDCGSNNRATFLEWLNIVLCVAGFGPEYGLCEKEFSTIMERDLNYFEIVSLLYYFRGADKYSASNQAIESTIDQQLQDLSVLETSSESVHLFLDVLTCPHVSQELREKLLIKYLQRYEPDVCTSRASDLLSHLATICWFVRWDRPDLRELLERKELKQAY